MNWLFLIVTMTLITLPTTKAIAFEYRGFDSTMTLAGAKTAASKLGSSLEEVRADFGIYYRVTGTTLTLSFCQGRLASLYETVEGATLDEFAGAVRDAELGRSIEPKIQIVGAGALSTIDAQFALPDRESLTIQYQSWQGGPPYLAKTFSSNCE